MGKSGGKAAFGFGSLFVVVGALLASYYPPSNIYFLLSGIIFIVSGVVLIVKGFNEKKG